MFETFLQYLEEIEECAWEIKDFIYSDAEDADEYEREIMSQNAAYKYMLKKIEDWIKPKENEQSYVVLRGDESNCNITQ